MSGSVSTCQALTVVSVPEDTHSKRMGDAARVGAVLICTTYSSIWDISYKCLSI